MQTLNNRFNSIHKDTLDWMGDSYKKQFQHWYVIWIHINFHINNGKSFSTKLEFENSVKDLELQEIYLQIFDTNLRGGFRLF